MREYEKKVMDKLYEIADIVAPDLGKSSMSIIEKHMKNYDIARHEQLKAMGLHSLKSIMGEGNGDAYALAMKHRTDRTLSLTLEYILTKGKIGNAR